MENVRVSIEMRLDPRELAQSIAARLSGIPMHELETDDDLILAAVRDEIQTYAYDNGGMHGTFDIRSVSPMRSMLALYPLITEALASRQK